MTRWTSALFILIWLMIEVKATCFNRAYRYQRLMIVWAVSIIIWEWSFSLLCKPLDASLSSRDRWFISSADTDDRHRQTFSGVVARSPFLRPLERNRSDRMSNINIGGDEERSSSILYSISIDGRQCVGWSERIAWNSVFPAQAIKSFALVLSLSLSAKQHWLSSKKRRPFIRLAEVLIADEADWIC